MATRLYLPSTGAAAVSPAYAAWDDSSQAAARRKCVTAKIASGIEQVAIDDGIGLIGKRFLWRQFVSDPLPAGAITGTVKGQARCYQTDGMGNHDQICLCVKVVSGDGATLRGTLLALGQYGSTNEYPQAEDEAGSQNRKIADGDALSSVTASAGDRLVIEIGTRPSTAPLSLDDLPVIVFEDANGALDLGENETDDSGDPWVEFSQDLFPPAELDVTPAAVVATASVPSVTIERSVTPAAAAATASVPSVTIERGVTPAAVTATASVPTPALERAITPAAVTATASVPDPVVEGSIFPAAVEASAIVPDPEFAGALVGSYDPLAVVSQDWVPLRASSPAALGDQNVSTSVSGTIVGPSIVVAATTMQDLLDGLILGTITHVIFRCVAYIFDIGPYWGVVSSDSNPAHAWPVAPNSRMRWTVGVDSAESALINDDPAIGIGMAQPSVPVPGGVPTAGFVWHVEEDGFDPEDEFIPLDCMLHTAPILLQPNGQPWTQAALNALANVRVLYDHGDVDGVDLQGCEIYAEVYGPLGSKIVPFSVPSRVGKLVFHAKIDTTDEGG